MIYYARLFTVRSRVVYGALRITLHYAKYDPDSSNRGTQYTVCRNVMTCKSKHINNSRKTNHYRIEIRVKSLLARGVPPDTVYG